jgi:hypothetical protein
VPSNYSRLSTCCHFLRCLVTPFPWHFLSTRSQPVQPLLAAMGMPDEVQRVADMLDVTTTIRHNGGAIEIIDATVRFVRWGDGGGGRLHACRLTRTCRCRQCSPSQITRKHTHNINVGKRRHTNVTWLCMTCTCFFILSSAWTVGAGVLIVDGTARWSPPWLHPHGWQHRDPGRPHEAVERTGGRAAGEPRVPRTAPRPAANSVCEGGDTAAGRCVSVPP